MRFFPALFFFLAMAAAAYAQSASIVPTPGKVVGVIQTARGSFVETTRGTYSISEDDNCEQQICFTPDVMRGLPERAPDGALPDGSIARSNQGDIRKAWYARPTERYPHAVLGDAIEGGSLVVEMVDGSRLELVLPDDQVFEDITPRLHDLNFDGKNEVVTIRSSQSGGAAIVVYGVKDGEITQIAASSENGLRNRWLNIVGVLPQKNSSSSSIYFIRTPHINGRLNRLDVGQSGFQDLDLKQNNFSNHVIGSRELGLGLLVPGSEPRMYIPSQNRQTLRQILGSQFEIALPGRISHALIALDNRLVTATENGELVMIFD